MRSNEKETCNAMCNVQCAFIHRDTENETQIHRQIEWDEKETTKRIQACDTSLLH